MTKEHLHLGPEELDLYLEDRLPEHRASHLETCDLCRTAAEETRDLVLRLAELPRVAPGRRFAEGVMARVAVEHLTPEDLDLWVSGALPRPREAHLRSCPECQALADAERMLVLRLQALPLFAPAPGLADRVMGHVDLPVTSIATAWRSWRNRAFAEPISVITAAGVAMLLGGSVAASAAWAAGNQETITGVGAWLLNQGQQLFWQGAGAATALLERQSWYGPLRDAVTPARLIVAGGVGIGLYAAGVAALRRLLALPPAQVARALP